MSSDVLKYITNLFSGKLDVANTRDLWPYYDPAAGVKFLYCALSDLNL